MWIIALLFRAIQNKLTSIQKKLSRIKLSHHEISEILTALASKTNSLLALLPTDEEISNILNELSTQIDTITKELNRLFHFSTKLDSKYGSLTISKQGKDILKSDIEKTLQQLTLKFTSSLGAYSKIYLVTHSDQRDDLGDKFIELRHAAIALIQLFDSALEIKPIYSIDNEMKKKANDILEMISRYIEVCDSLGYVPPSPQEEKPMGLRR